MKQEESRNLAAADSHTSTERRTAHVRKDYGKAGFPEISPIWFPYGSSRLRRSMNISLVDESATLKRRYPARYGSFPHCFRRAVNKGVAWLSSSSSSLLKKSLLSISACCKPAPASSPSPPAPSTACLMQYHELDNELERSCWYPIETLLLQSCAGLLRPYDENTVVVKVGIIGDSQTGKTSLMENYVLAGDKRRSPSLHALGVSSMDKVFEVQSAKIAVNIWELGDFKELMAPAVCNDAAAVLILFDLTRRATLHSVKRWYTIARQINKKALPVLVGTKFDQFMSMPESIKALVTKQARVYAQAMGAPLLFTSTPYSINVNKLFKIVLAKIFDLPCNIAKNLNPGEPVVEY